MNYINTPAAPPIVDPHSFSQPEKAVIRHVDWVLAVDFDRKQLTGSGVYHIAHQQVGELILDVKDLMVVQVQEMPSGKALAFWLSPPMPHVGQGLHIPLSPATNYPNKNSFCHHRHL